MAEKKKAEIRKTTSVSFTLPSLLVFVASITVANSLLVFFLLRLMPHVANKPAPVASTAITQEPDRAPDIIPPWGELVTSDVDLEHPEEYLSTMVGMPTTPTWVFTGMTNEQQVRELMSRCGLTAGQLDQALAPGHVVTKEKDVLVNPTESLVRSLSPEVRGNLYNELSTGANFFICFPACFPDNSLDLEAYADKLGPEIIDLVNSLAFKRGNVTYFSDFEVVMAHTTSIEQRRELLKALSREPAVFARIRIRPNTDVDKLLGYWTQAPGVRVKDLRPLLESVKQLPNGSTLSLLYFLPPLARERLFTYPLPARPGDSVMDCHWSSMNFFSETPDNRLNDPGYVNQLLARDYYPVEHPSKYGDIIVLFDRQGKGIHSAVHIADDLVFTKNGNNHLKPWILMRLNKLVAIYSREGTPTVVAYRNKAF